MTRVLIFGCIAMALLSLRSRVGAVQQPGEPAATRSDAAADPLAPPRPDPRAEAVVQQARERIAQWRSLRARLIERVELGDRRLKVQGTYLAGEFPRMRLEFDVAVGDQRGTQLEVCDGQVLHIQRTIRKAKAPEAAPPRAGAETATTPSGAPDAAPIAEAEKPVVEAIRRDVQQILRSAPNLQNLALPMHAADLGLGGLPAMLASLDRTLVFDAVRDEEFEGRRYQVVNGRWNPDYLNALTGQLGGAAGQVAPFLPDAVRIYFEAETLFPMRILHLKRASPESQTLRPMLSLEFHDVEFDPPLPSDAFLYSPPAGVDEVDDTSEFLQLLQGPPPAAAGAGGPAGAGGQRAPTGEAPGGR